MKAVKLVIDENLCQGHGRCYSTAPDLFTPKDDYGHSEVVEDGVLGDGLAEVEEARRAADACPERAITLVTS